MVDAINTLSATQTQSRNEPVTEPVSRIEIEPALPQNSFTTSSIRVDNLLDLAILEFRASDTGDILRQYPTEQQLQSFQRAAQLSEDSANVQVQTEPRVSETVTPSQAQQPQQVNADQAAQASQAASVETNGTGVNVTQGTTATLSDSSSTTA